MSLALAVPNEKQAAKKYGINTAGFLPYLMNIRYSIAHRQIECSCNLKLTVHLTGPIVGVLIQTLTSKTRHLTN